MKSGTYDYDELLEMANKKQEQMQQAFKVSKLQSSPDINRLDRIAYEIREAFYSQND